MNLLYLNQFKTTTLSVPGGIDASQTDSIVVQSVAGIDTTKPGIACVSYSDPINVDNAEWFEYQSINSTTKEFQGVTRGAEGYSAKSHDNGAVIAFPVSESHINRLADALSIDSDPTNGVTGVIDDDTMAAASATTLATSESIKRYATPVDGWISAGETWSYASATTITVPSGAAAKYSKGDKIKLTQTTVKYFYIVGVADELLTITAGSTYTLANEAITDNYYSHVENPVGFPSFFNWSPSPTWGGGTTNPTSLTVAYGAFSVSGRTCFLTFRADVVRGSGNRTNVKFPTPINKTSSDYTPVSAFDNVAQASVTVKACYLESNFFFMAHGALTQDGFLSVMGHYQY